MNEMLLLKQLIAEAKLHNKKLYQEWHVISEREYPTFDEHGKYIPKFFCENKPSKELEHARQLYLWWNSYLSTLEQAEFALNQWAALNHE